MRTVGIPTYCTSLERIPSEAVRRKSLAYGSTGCLGRRADPAIIQPLLEARTRGTSGPASVRLVRRFRFPDTRNVPGSLWRVLTVAVGRLQGASPLLLFVPR